MSRYVLVVLGIPLHRHGGQLFAADLWAKDLALHFDYLESIRLVCPVLEEAPPEGMSPLPTEIADRIELAPMRVPASIIPRFLSPVQEWRNVRRFLRIIAEADLVHVTLNERPVHWGLLAWFLRRFRATRMLVVVESTSSWRWLDAKGFAAARRWVVEKFARMAVRNAQFAVFTTREYQETLGPSAGLEAVIPASWIDEGTIASRNKVESREHGRNTPLRVGYFAHLSRAKGLDLLIEAIKLANADRCRIVADVYGSGPEAEDFRSMAVDCGDSVRFKGTIAYEGFHEVVASCDVVAVPNRLDEQPRIVYDAFSQGVPVVGSDTQGISACMLDGREGLLFRRGDARALAAALLKLDNDPALLKRMSLDAWESAKTHTHKGMHEQRARILATANPPIAALRVR